MEVLRDGLTVVEVAERYGVSRQAVHGWLRRYASGGLDALADRSHRPRHCPHQMPAAVEAHLCELCRRHPRWGQRRLAQELAQIGVDPPPGLTSIYRALVRNGLIQPRTRRRAKASYRRWERSQPMELWQLDVMGGIWCCPMTPQCCTTPPWRICAWGCARSWCWPWWWPAGRW
jgi:transposase